MTKHKSYSFFKREGVTVGCGSWWRTSQRRRAKLSSSHIKKTRKELKEVFK